jgi:hypothetical protein
MAPRTRRRVLLSLVHFGPIKTWILGWPRRKLSPPQGCLSVVCLSAHRAQLRPTTGRLRYSGVSARARHLQQRRLHRLLAPQSLSLKDSVLLGEHLLHQHRHSQHLSRRHPRSEVEVSAKAPLVQSRLLHQHLGKQQVPGNPHSGNRALVSLRRAILRSDPQHPRLQQGTQPLVNPPSPNQGPLGAASARVHSASPLHSHPNLLPQGRRHPCLLRSAAAAEAEGLRPSLGQVWQVWACNQPRSTPPREPHPGPQHQRLEELLRHPRLNGRYQRLQLQ